MSVGVGEVVRSGRSRVGAGGTRPRGMEGLACWGGKMVNYQHMQAVDKHTTEAQEWQEDRREG